MLGTLLNDRYKLLQILGSGGFGQTYIAEDTKHPDHLQCVVKQFKPSIQDASFLKTARRLFFSEVETLKKLGSHDQIPTLLDHFEQDHEFYLVQDYIEGVPLNHELAIVKRLDEPSVIALLRDVLEVLEFVHSNRVIHRDIKPSNLIRRQQDGKFVLIDFGAVKELHTQFTLVPGQSAFTIGIGTQGYGPSEQLVGKPRYNSDLYALGMTAIQALTGLHPYQLPTDSDTGEVIWRDHAQVSPKLAGILTRMVRYHFNHRYQSATEVLQALNQPAEMIEETQLPATLLTGNSATDTSVESTEVTQLLKARWQPMIRASLSVGIASFVVTGLLVGLRVSGGLQSLEIATFDRMVQFSPDPGTDPRLLVVGISEVDIQEQQRFPLSDRTIAQALKMLQIYQPRAIGLDLLRDIPQEPGRAELLKQLEATNVIAIKNLGTSDIPPTPAPAGVPSDRIGFNDLLLDEDGVVRRNLMFADQENDSFFSFSLRLALTYLAARDIALKANPQDSNLIDFGNATIAPLQHNSGGYQTIDDRGYQILLQYRSRTIARQIRLGDLLKGRLQPEWVKDRIVLIGTTAPSAKDLFLTPYSATQREHLRVPGVLIHAYQISQFLSAALDGQRLFWFWPDWLEVVWIGGWAIAGGSLAWWLRHPLILGLSETLLLAMLAASCFWLFTRQGWIPSAVPAVAILFTAGLVTAYRGYQEN
jgi:CHASE2 domain-containing sensor protein